MSNGDSAVGLVPSKELLTTSIGLFLVSLTGVIVWLAFGWAFAGLGALTLLGCLLGLKGFRRYLLDHDWSMVTAHLVTPAFICYMFGFGGLLCLRQPPLAFYYGPFNDTEVFLMGFYAFLGAIAYYGGFQVVSGARSDRSWDVRVRQGGLILFLAICLPINWIVVYRVISQGLFVKWLAETYLDESSIQTSFFFHLYRLTFPFLLAILVYLESINRHSALRWVYRALLAIQLTIVWLAVNRLDILLSTAVCAFSYMVIHRPRINWRLVAVAGVAVLCFFVFIGPLIQEARTSMRTDGAELLKSPATIPLRILDTYLPNAFRNQYLSSNPTPPPSNQGFLFRSGSYMSYAATMYHALRKGESLQSPEKALEVLKSLVPRFLLPSKGSVDADAQLMRHFNIGYMGLDATGSYIADVFSYFHFVGVVGLFLFGGIFFGATARYLRWRYGQVGEIMLIGLLPAFITAGDFFGGYLVSMRNILALVLLVFPLILWRESPDAGKNPA